MKRRLTLATGAALVTAILAVVNLLAAFAPLRLDLSRGGIYSLTQASKRLVRELDDPIWIKVYASELKNLPAEHKSNRRYLESFLREYAQASKGRVRHEFVKVDGPDGEESRKEAVSEGISPVRFNIYSRGRLEIQEGMMGLTLRYADQKEALPFIGDVTTLEYDLSSRIKRMTRKRKPVVAFVAGLGTGDVGDLPQRVQAALRANYEVRSVNLQDPKEPIAADVKAAWVLGPDKMSPGAKYVLDQFLLSGRSLAVAVDNRRVDFRSFYSAPLESGASDWLASYGVRVQPEMVLDALNQKVQITTQQDVFQFVNIVEFPPMIQVRDLDRDHPATRELDAVILPFASPVVISTGTPRSTILARSSPMSWTRSGRRAGSINPFEGFAPEASDAKGPFPLAAVVEGRFESAFKAPPEGFKPGAFQPRSQADGRLVVAGTSKFIRSDTPLHPVNEAFFLNLTDWMLQESDLIAIRSKPVAFTPLKPLPEGSKFAVTLANMFGPSLIVFSAGLWRWRERRRFKATRARAYGLASDHDAETA